MKLRFATCCLFLLCILLSPRQLLAGEARDYDFIIAADGSGDFTTVQQAINAVPDYRKITTKILIRRGIYKEKIVLAESKQNIVFTGEDNEETVISNDDFARKKNRFGEEMGTSGSSGFYIYGVNIRFEHICFRNTAGPVGQAVAVFVAGDKVQFTDCRFLGFQDTLYTYGRNSRQYYLRCYIEGTVDFIFGAATAVFDSCTLYGKEAGYYTAASTPEGTAYGYVFRYCRLTGNAGKATFSLGRPWRPYARTVFLHCAMEALVKADGWDNWGNKENESTAYYGEYKSMGPGGNTAGRAPWAHTLTAAEAGSYTLAHIFKDWAPETSLR